MATAHNLRSTIVPNSNQLNADDVFDVTKDVTVTDVRLHQSEDQPLIVHYEGDDGRPFKPCLSMRRVLIAFWGDKAADWKGKSMRLYGDPDVRFGGQAVGGIRISHMTHLDGPKTIMLTISRGRRSAYTVQPMEPPTREPLTDELFRDKLPAIKSLIEAGKSTPEQAITNLQKHYGEPTKEQRAEIRAITKEQSE